LLDTVDSIRHERFELEITEDEEVEELTKVLNRIRKYAKIHRLLAELSKPNQ
jgi:EAL domain-containing protein (putative c-di-GMP-specific phosphodiesterase class I)